MDGSIWGRYLPWTLVLVMTVTGLSFYARSPVWEFEVDLRDEKEAASPALELYQRIATKVHNPALKGKPARINVLFRSEAGWQRERLIKYDGIGCLVTADVQSGSFYFNEEELSSREFRDRLREYADAADAVESPAVVLLGTPDCSLRELAEFLRLGQNRILWAVQLP